MDFSIITANWTSRDYLHKCPAPIATTTCASDLEILVIANASFDGCAETSRQHYPKFRFIQSTHKVGFAKANNAASRGSRGRTILFSNLDTELAIPGIDIVALRDVAGHRFEGVCP
jgi:N-acetylglucosaminyl-diphospho-decaprenol L-rhamnosyltransferase